METHIHVHTHTHTCSHLHTWHPGQEKQRGLMDSSPAAEDEKTSVKNFHVYTPRGSLWLTGWRKWNKRQRKKNGVQYWRKWSKAVKNVALRSLVLQPGGPVTFKCLGSAVTKFPPEVKNFSERLIFRVERWCQWGFFSCFLIISFDWNRIFGQWGQWVDSANVLEILWRRHLKTWREPHLTHSETAVSACLAPVMWCVYYNYARDLKI